MNNEPLLPIDTAPEPTARGDGTFAFQQLLNDLRKIAREFEWNVDQHHRLQGVLRIDDELQLFDPVTAVAYFRTREFYPLSHSREAARRLGLSFLGSVNAVAACQYAWHRSSRLGSLREALIDVLRETTGDQFIQGVSAVH